MRLQQMYRWAGTVWLPAALLLASAPTTARAQNVATAPTATAGASMQAQAPTAPSFEIYGFAMLDIGHDFKQIHPNWSDTLRVTRLPSFENEFGRDHSTFAGVRQSRLGVRATTPTSLGDLKTTFEFELFGTGVDEGQTTFRLRHAYGELGQFGAGQTWSPFMDPDVFPNSLEYWGPTGMVFFRNVQFRWMPIQGANSLTLALERPGASGDQGVYEDRVELDGIQGRFPMPDVSAVLQTRPWTGAICARPECSGSSSGTTPSTTSSTSQTARPAGASISARTSRPSDSDVIRLQFAFGEGIQNYWNDAPVDIGIENDFGNPTAPIRGVALPIIGLVAFIDHTWNEKFSSTFGYSRTDIDNSDGTGAERLQGRPVHARQPALLARCRTSWSEANCNGAVARISRTTSTATASRCSSRSNTTSGTRLEARYGEDDISSCVRGRARPGDDAGSHHQCARADGRRSRCGAQGRAHEVPEHHGRQERRLHSGARQG